MKFQSFETVSHARRRDAATRGDLSMQVQSYLSFNGRCEEAIEFYKSALGAKLEMLLRFKDSPDPQTAEHMPPGTENKVMHASLRIGDTMIGLSDGMCTGGTKFEGISLTVIVPTTAEAEKFFAALGQGGQVQMPLTETFFSPRFGMVADKFGVSWMVMVDKK
jgi:PhnB protein